MEPGGMKPQAAINPFKNQPQRQTRPALKEFAPQTPQTTSAMQIRTPPGITRRVDGLSHSLAFLLAEPTQAGQKSFGQLNL